MYSDYKVFPYLARHKYLAIVFAIIQLFLSTFIAVPLLNFSYIILTKRHANNGKTHKPIDSVEMKSMKETKQCEKGLEMPYKKCECIEKGTNEDIKQKSI